MNLRKSTRLPSSGQKKSPLIVTLGFLGFPWFSIVFVCFFPRISESDVLTRCSYDSSLTVLVKYFRVDSKVLTSKIKILAFPRFDLEQFGFRKVREVCRIHVDQLSYL